MTTRPRLWDIVYDEQEPMQLVDLDVVAHGEIEASWSPDERRHLRRRVAPFLGDLSWNRPTTREDEPEPITFAYECNWFDGTWHREVHRVISGRHRLTAARALHLSSVWAVVVDRAFFPSNQRPPDRAEMATTETSDWPDAHGHL
jgi:hypothetical protein